MASLAGTGLIQVYGQRFTGLFNKRFLRTCCLSFALDPGATGREMLSAPMVDLTFQCLLPSSVRSETVDAEGRVWLEIPQEVLRRKFRRAL